MTASKEKTFMDWLFGSSAAANAQTTVQVGDEHLPIEELQREIERERAKAHAELEALRTSKTEAEAARDRGLADLEKANGELLAAKAALEAAQSEVARLTRQATDSSAASARDGEARRKLSGRCSTLQFELDKLRSVLEAKSKKEAELEQALQQQGAASEEAQAAAAAAQRSELLRQEERVHELEQLATSVNNEFAEFQSTSRSQLSVRQSELEQRQKEISVARADIERLQKDFKRQQASFIQASGHQQTALEAERRAWASWLGQVWNALLHTLGPAAPLALETYLNDIEPIAHATSTEAAEARLRDFLAARSLCRNVAIVEQQSELRLELEPGPALEGTAAGWVGILATRQLAAMLQRPLCTRRMEQAGATLTVHTTSRPENAEARAVSI